MQGNVYPCVHNQPLCCCCHHHHSVHRLAGSYQSLDAGTTGDALVDFSGGVCEKIKLESYVDTLDNRDALFDVSLAVSHHRPVLLHVLGLSFGGCDK